MNGRDGMLEETRLQHSRVEHEGVEMWESDRPIVGGDATPTPNATPMSIVLALWTASRIGTETKRLPMEYERRQMRNRTQHCTKRAEINHDPEGPRVVAIPPQRQR